MAEKEKGSNTKEMLKRNAEAKRKIRWNDRLTVEVVQNTKHLKKGEILTPHRVQAEQFIKEGIAKEVK